MNSDLDEVFERLASSDFRRRFRLRAVEREYLERKGLETVMCHGEKFIDERLAHRMTASRLRCATTRSSSLSTGPQPAAEAALRNGTQSPKVMP
jgi:hypothetical protein